MTMEDGIDRFRDEEDEETLLPILPSRSRGVTVAKDNISTLCHEGIVVNSGNEPAPGNS